MGKPSPLYDIDLMTPDGQSASVGESGEIVIKVGDKAPCGLFCGYYRDEEKTKEVYHDGYYHTGDVAWRDEDGYYWYVGRIDDLIKTRGYRVGPFEIENVLMEHPAVMECAVTGIPDKARGQAIKATIHLAKGFDKSKELMQDIKHFVNSKVASYKHIQHIEFIDEMPKTISGKIKRIDIRDIDRTKLC